MSLKQPFPAYRGAEKHIFVCYAHADSNIVYPEITSLHDNDINIWYDEGIDVGQEWRAEIAEALDRASTVLFYQSAASIRSKHCVREISYALDAEIPIVRVDLDGSDLPPALRLGLQAEQGIDPNTYSREEYTRKLYRALEAPSTPVVELPKVQRSSPRSPLYASGALIVAVLSLMTALSTTWWFTRTPQPSVLPDLVSVLIIDFDNRTGDAVFEGALEQALSDGIEEASFITAYSRADAQRLAQEITPGSELDAPVARLVSVREGINMILAGSIKTSGDGYAIVVRTLDPVLDDPQNEFEAAAASREDVLETVASLAIRVREALGDTDAKDLETGETYTASSLEAAHAYTLAQKMALRFEDEEARTQYLRATELDPRFGRAYAGLAISTDRLGRADESRAAWEMALSLVERMTEREKYRTLGVYYGRFSRNYDLAIENFQSLLERFPADDAGRNNLAMSYFSARSFADALEQERLALDLYPNRLLYRGNHAFFAMYASEFKIAAEGAERLMVDHPGYFPGHQLKAMAAMAMGELAAAEDTYRSLTLMDEPAASIGVIGLVDHNPKTTTTVPLRRCIGKDSNEWILNNICHPGQKDNDTYVCKADSQFARIVWYEVQAKR